MRAMSELTEEEVKLLKGLEEEGLITKGSIRKVQIAMRQGHKHQIDAIKIRIGVGGMFLATALTSAAVAFEQTKWLSVLLGTNAGLCGLAGLMLVLSVLL
jgi:hypothetical protein